MRSPMKTIWTEISDFDTICQTIFILSNLVGSDKQQLDMTRLQQVPPKVRELKGPEHHGADDNARHIVSEHEGK